MRAAALFGKLDALPLHEERAFLASGFDDIYLHLREHLGAREQDAIAGLLAQRPACQFSLVATEAWLRMGFGGESADEVSDKLLALRTPAAA